MTTQSVQIKRVAEDRLYDFDFASLGDPEVMVQSGTVVQSNLQRVDGSLDLTLEGSAVAAGTLLQQRVKGGTDGELYKLTAEVLDDDGNTLVMFGFLQVSDGLLPNSLTVGIDSYLDLMEADAYWANRNNRTWEIANPADKEKALRAATQYLDATYQWIGELADPTQRLGWPRSWAYDGEGRLLQGVPVKVRQAASELALAALEDPLLAVESRGGDVRREKVGVLEVEYFDGAPGGRSFPLVDRLLADLVRAGPNHRRLLRS